MLTQKMKLYFKILFFRPKKWWRHQNWQKREKLPK